jgi:hypothetical protein
MDALNAELAENFSRWDRGEPDAAPALSTQLKTVLSKIAYLRTLIRDVDREIENLRAA